MQEPIILPHGGYRKLKSFHVAQLVFDLTAKFCDEYIERRSRTHDQMVQAARSGVQNIAEGSQASATSKRTELKLTSVARASLEELRLDYEDFLRQRSLPLWGREDKRRQALIDARPKQLADFAHWARAIKGGQLRGAGGDCGHSGRSGRGGLRGPEQTYKLSAQRRQSGPLGLDGDTGSNKQAINEFTPSTVSTESTASTESTESTESAGPLPGYREIYANGVLALISVASTLLDRQLKAQAKAFQEEGGFTERLFRERQNYRRRR